MDKLVYVAEVMKILGISHVTLHELVRRRKLAPGRMLNHRLCWTTGEVQSLIDRIPQRRIEAKRGKPFGIEKIPDVGEDGAIAAARRILLSYHVDAEVEELAEVIRGEKGRSRSAPASAAA